MSEPHWGPGFIEACFGGNPRPSDDLIARLRAKPCSTISPPAIELEAADRIEALENELARVRDLAFGDDAHKGRAYSMMVEAHKSGLEVNFVTGDIALPKGKQA